jgi:DnaJ-class molecular chaperone
MGILSVFLPCEIVREYFYGVGDSKNGSVSASLYQTLRIGPSASPAEIRVAFKLRSLEVNTIGAARAEHVKLERAFNILGHPELRAHYERLLADPELRAIFPYGGVGSILVAGDRSRSGETFFARRILAFVPDQTHRRFHLPVRNCEFYGDKLPISSFGKSQTRKKTKRRTKAAKPTRSERALIEWVKDEA